MAAVRLLLLLPSPPRGRFIFLLLSVVVSSFFFSLSSALSSRETLLKFKKSLNNTESLQSWAKDSSPCTMEMHWVGVVCLHGIITGLHLGNMGISGEIDIDALTNLPALRTLSLINNSFSGRIPEFNRIGALKALYLTQNHFSGEIPDDFFEKMKSLKKVWLAHNAFTGPIPKSLSKPERLIELHLEHNQFTGDLPEISQKNLMSFNVSENPKLEGEIPKSLEKFNGTAFLGNPGLCRESLGNECNPGPESPTAAGSKLDLGMSTAIGITIILFLLLVTIGALITRRGANTVEFNKLKREDSINDSVVDVCVSSHNNRKGTATTRQSSSRRGESSHQRRESHTGKKSVGDLVMVNDSKGVFGLPDLMKAVAEVLGGGTGLGSAYKAVMANGTAVVVKRMKEMNRVGPDGFEAEMRRLGGLRHPNLVTPLAYHYRKEEKLLVYDFVPGGSLSFLLHGTKGARRVDFNLSARIKIVQGIGHGLAYIHEQLPNSDIPHGNLKSANVLLAPDLSPLLVDFGFSPLVTPTHASTSLFAYKAPESLRYRHVSPKSDVYCLGILILEIVTGKYMSQGGSDVVAWVNSAVAEKRESELFDPEITSDSLDARAAIERLLRLGAACAEPNAEERLDVREAVRRIEEIATTATAAASSSEGREEGSVAAEQCNSVRSRSSQRRKSSSDLMGFSHLSEENAGSSTQ